MGVVRFNPPPQVPIEGFQHNLENCSPIKVRQLSVLCTDSSIWPAAQIQVRAQRNEAVEICGRGKVVQQG